MRVRGLKVALVDDSSKTQYVEAEFLCESEAGVQNCCKFLEYATNNFQVQFIKLHISGDKHTKYGTDIKLNQPANQAVAELFQKGIFQMLTEFKFTDFYTEPFSLIVLVQALQGNQSLSHIDLSRNEINDETAAAVIQYLYGNFRLQRLNLDGNPISTGLFKEQYIRPYFSSRNDIKIVLG
eukprot:403340383